MTRLSEEQREILISSCRCMIEREDTSEWSENIRKVSEIALSCLQQKPVEISNDMAVAFFQALTDDPIGVDDIEECKVGLRAAFANVPLPAVLMDVNLSLKLPAEWVAVPVKPTKDMLGKVHPINEATCPDCGRLVTADCEENVLLSWDDMLAAAPKPAAFMLEGE